MKGKTVKYSYNHSYFGYDILRGSLSGTVFTNTIQVCELTKTLERALYQKSS